MRDRVRHQRNLESGVIHRIDGQADAIDADRTFLGDLAQEWLRRGEDPALRARIIGHRFSSRAENLDLLDAMWKNERGVTLCACGIRGSGPLFVSVLLI